MEAQAISKYLRTTPRKGRLVADVIRGKMVGQALVMLEFGIQKKVAEDFSKAIKSAVANLQSKNTELNINLDELKVKEVHVQQGPMLKRFRARAQGRYGRILKQMCHIKVVVGN